MEKFLVCQFEAVSIQEYIMASTKLKEMVGASQLLEALTTTVLDKVLSALSLKEIQADENFSLSKLSATNIVFPRRAGGVFLMVMHNNDAAQNFVQLWPLLVQQFAPGLKFSFATERDEEIKPAIGKVRNLLNAQKNTPKATLPELTPVTHRSPTTGGAAVSVETSNNQSMSVDQPTRVKNISQNKVVFPNVMNKWLPDNETDRFPKVFEHTQKSESKEYFPFSTKEGEHTIAIVHADGNGVGQYIRTFFEKLEAVNDEVFIKAYSAFSQGMDNATQKAAQSAMAWLIMEHPEGALPIRPLILSGDDVTCILRSDCAFEFMKRLVKAFEEESKIELDKLSAIDKNARSVFPDYLTMTTGMVFMRSNQPFHMGYHLAESLCSHSKDLGRKARQTSEGIIPSTLSFVHSTSSLFDNAEDYIATELTVCSTKNGTKGIKLSQEVYLLGKEVEGLKEEIVPFTALQDLVDVMDENNLNISFLRQLATTLQLDPAHGQRMISRWIEINSEHGSQAIDALNEVLKQHFGLDNVHALTTQNNPLSDLIAYQGLTQKGSYND